MIKNESGLHPLGQAVLLVPYESDLYRKGSLIEIPDSYKGRLRSIENRAIVLEIGPEAWYGEEHPRASVGDKVMISKYAGTLAQGPKDGLEYRMVNAGDIFCRIEDGLDLAEFLERRKNGG